MGFFVGVAEKDCICEMCGGAATSAPCLLYTLVQEGIERIAPEKSRMRRSRRDEQHQYNSHPLSHQNLAIRHFRYNALRLQLRDYRFPVGLHTSDYTSESG